MAKSPHKGDLMGCLMEVLRSFEWIFGRVSEFNGDIRAER